MLVEKRQLKSLNSNLSVEPAFCEFPVEFLPIIYLDQSLFLGEWSALKKVSLDEFQIGLEIIRNSTANVEFKIVIAGQIWSLNLNLTKLNSHS